MHTKIILLIFILWIASPVMSAFAQPPAQEMSGEERRRELEKQAEELRQKIEKKPEAPQVKEELPPPKPGLESKEKVLVKQINVIGATLIKEKEINKIIAGLQGKEVTITELQKTADKITDAYRQKGYITSRAYLPPQKIAQGIVEIRILEGLMGNVEVKGNHYFKTRLLRNKITLKKGAPFDYDLLRRNLVKINEHPDRSSRAVLVPGKEAGTTDIVLEVKDRLPLHAGFSVDNFGSRYIKKQRYSTQFTHNNLLGFDDKLTFQYQFAQQGRYMLKNIRYLLPATSKLDLGLYAAFSRVKLDQDFEDADARGKSQLYGLFANVDLIDKENFDLTLNLGFDYKDIINYQNQRATSHDRLRVAKTGFESDLTDNFGRTLFTYEFDYGIPDMWGGLKKQDINASRTGAGGKFVKNNINLLRLQKLPFSSTLLWKNQIQLSPYILSAAEQFQLGGIINVRGYPPAEMVGDEGYSMTWEWSIPPYFVPRKIKVPLSQAKLYDALRFVTFYDWGNVRLRRPIVTEEKNKTLRSAGWGVRFNLPENFSLRAEFAWPLDNTPTDSDHLHTLFQVSKEF